MFGVVVSTSGAVTVRDVPEPLWKTAQEIVGGMWETVQPMPMRLRGPYLFLCNETGLLDHLPLNEVGCYLYGSDVHGQIIVGDILILQQGYTEDGEADLFGVDLLTADSIMHECHEILKLIHGPLYRTRPLVKK